MHSSMLKPRYKMPFSGSSVDVSVRSAVRPRMPRKDEKTKRERQRLRFRENLSGEASRTKDLHTEEERRLKHTETEARARTHRGIHAEHVTTCMQAHPSAREDEMEKSSSTLPARAHPRTDMEQTRGHTRVDQWRHRHVYTSAEIHVVRVPACISTFTGRRRS